MQRYLFPPNTRSFLHITTGNCVRPERKHRHQNDISRSVSVQFVSSLPWFSYLSSLHGVNENCWQASRWRGDHKTQQVGDTRARMACEPNGVSEPPQVPSSGIVFINSWSGRRWRTVRGRIFCELSPYTLSTTRKSFSAYKAFCKSYMYRPPVGTYVSFFYIVVLSYRHTQAMGSEEVRTGTCTYMYLGKSQIHIHVKAATRRPAGGAEIEQ